MSTPYIAPSIAPGKINRLLAYGFRPFFLLAAGYAVIGILAWSGFLLGWLPPPPGDPFTWHMHEMVYGFGGAALAGFLLTAVPEFTGDPPHTGRTLAILVLCWLLARLAMWLSGMFGVLPAAVLNLMFLGALIGLVGPSLWSRALGRHRAFLYALIALWLIQTASFYAWDNTALWTVRDGLNTAVGLFAILIIVALARISMVIVNGALEKAGETETSYLARPPRRKLAIFAIALFLLLDVVQPGQTLTGWVALAAMAATLNILNDWHLPRTLRDPYVLALYGTFWFIALGFGSIGIENLTGGWAGRGGRHLLSVGAMGLAVLAVLSIAGQVHTGRELAYTWQIKLSFALMILAGLARAVPPQWASDSYTMIAYGMSGLLWVGAFCLYLVHIGPMLWRPRADGEPG